MNPTRRQLPSTIGVATAVGASGCLSGRGERCLQAAESLETTIQDGTRTDVKGLEEAWPMRYRDAGATSYAEQNGPAETVGYRRLYAGEEGFYPTVVVGHGRFYLTSRRAELLAIDPDDGTVDWRYDGLEAGGSSAAVTDGFVYVASDGGLHAVDAGTGERHWLLDDPITADGVVVVVDDTVYASTWDEVLAVDADTGEVNWRAAGEYLGAVADGRAFVNEGPRLRALDPVDGRPLWENDDVWSDGEIAVRGGTVYASSGGVSHFRYEPGRVFPIDVEDGTQRWVFESDAAESFQSPAVAPDVVAVCRTYRQVYVLDREDGRRRWCADLGGRALSAPVIGGDALYLVSGDAVQARRLDGGAHLWTKRLDEDERLDRDVEYFYHHQALSGTALFVACLGRRGLVVDGFVEHAT